MVQCLWGPIEIVWLILDNCQYYLGQAAFGSILFHLKTRVVSLENACVCRTEDLSVARHKLLNSQRTLPRDLLHGQKVRSRLYRR